KIFKGQAGVSKKIKERLLPKMEELGFICVMDSEVFINPSFMR
ncbi:DNA helicase, partial [Klebsiella phage vB_KpnS-VAC9]